MREGTFIGYAGQSVAAIFQSNWLQTPPINYCNDIRLKFWQKLIAERSEANNRDLWASESQLAFIYKYIYMYIYIYICISVRHAFPASGGKPRVQNGDSDSYMDAVFELLAQKEAEIWTSLLHRFIK